MDKLINLVAEKTGIGADKARTAVETVVGFLKDRLPGPLANKLDDAVNEKSQGSSEKQAPGKGLKDMLS
jgi:uncharacterized protein (DUF2267 family)